MIRFCIFIKTRSLTFVIFLLRFTTKFIEVECLIRHKNSIQLHTLLKTTKLNLIRAVIGASDYKFTGRSADKDECKRELTAKSR